jgi:hypothetical protein
MPANKLAILIEHFEPKPGSCFVADSFNLIADEHDRLQRENYFETLYFTKLRFSSSFNKIKFLNNLKKLVFWQRITQQISVCLKNGRRFLFQKKIFLQRNFNEILFTREFFH